MNLAPFGGLGFRVYIITVAELAYGASKSGSARHQIAAFHAFAHAGQCTCTPHGGVTCKLAHSLVAHVCRFLGGGSRL